MPETLLAAEDVRVRFGAAEVIAGASMALGVGEVVGLVGESGSGKTTLCRAMLGLQPLAGGRVSLDGRALADWPARALRRRTQFLLQDAASSLSPRMRVRALLAEPIRIHGLPSTTWAAMEALLHQLRLPGDILGKYPHELSGGQARRVAIARALILDPAVVVADEPTAGLDVSVQGEVLNLLLDLQASRGLAMLIVSHNLGVIRRVTQRMAVMYLGQVVEMGASAAVFARPAHPYTAALLSANPAVDPAKRHARVLLRGDAPSPAHPPAGCRFHTRCPAVQGLCRSAAPALADLGDGREARCHFPFAAAETTSPSPEEGAGGGVQAAH